MLQQGAFKPGGPPLCFLIVDHADHHCNELSPARMSVSRVSLDVHTSLRNELMQQDEYIRGTLAAGLVKEPSGMTEIKGTQSKRCSKEFRRGEDVGWGAAPTRCCKRREVTVERQSRSGEYTEKDHHLVQSGSSDLTTEQSVVCMAAESHSTRTTGSLDEDGCLLKLQSVAPAAAGYGDFHPNQADIGDEEEDNSSMPICNMTQAACVSYDVHRSTLQDHCTVGKDWLSANIHHDLKIPAAACTGYDQHEPNDSAEEDWLQLRLGSNFSALKASSLTLSSPCTLQLLPQEPDCALMKEREKHGELKLCSSDYTGKPLISNQADHEQARPSSEYLHSYLQAEDTREHPSNFYTRMMQASCLPMPPADSLGEYIACPSKIAVQHPTTADVSLYPTSTLDHRHTLHYTQHLQQLQESNMRYRAPLHASQEQMSFEPMSLGICPSLREGVQDVQEAPHIGMASRSPIPDFVHQNWNQLASVSAAACSMMQPMTSFRDLIASSFLKEPNTRYDNGMPLLASLQQPASSHLLPGKVSSKNSSPSDPNERINPNAVESNYIDNMNMGCKSMTSWLSQAVAATENVCVDRKLDDQSSPDVSLAPSLSRKQIIAERRLAKHSKSSKQTPLKCISRPKSRGSPGFWFALQPSQTKGCEADTSAPVKVPKSMTYIRMKSGDVPISTVKKFLIFKLGLSPDSQVGLACRGKFLEDTTDLKGIQEKIWLSGDFSPKERLNFRSSPSSSIRTSNNSIMILTYEIS